MDEEESELRSGQKGVAAIIIALVIAVALAVVGGVFFFTQGRSSPQPVVVGAAVATSSLAAQTTSTLPGSAAITSSTDTKYVNARIGYSFLIPRGFRLASDLMGFINQRFGAPISNWSATNTEEVVLTESNQFQEDQFIKTLSSTIDFRNLDTLPKTIVVAALPNTLTFEKTLIASLPTAQRLSLRETKVGGQDAIQFFNSSEVIVMIAYPGNATLSTGANIGTIWIRERAPDYQTGAEELAPILTSFRFE